MTDRGDCRGLAEDLAVRELRLDRAPGGRSGRRGVVRPLWPGDPGEARRRRPSGLSRRSAARLSPHFQLTV